MSDIPSLTELAAAPADGDLLVIHDVSASSPKDKKITTANLLANVPKTGANASLNDVTVNDITGVDATMSSVETTTLEFTGGAEITTMLTGTDTIDLTSVAAGATKTGTTTLTGVAVNDFVQWCALAAIPDDLIIQVYASGANTITVRAHNPTGTTVTGGTYSFRFVASRFA